MTVLDGQAPGIDLGAWPFDNRLDDLEMVGVSLALEQRRLFADVVGRSLTGEERPFAMTVEAQPDPLSSRSEPPVMELWSVDDQGDLEGPALLLLPRLVRLDWDLWPALDKTDPTWRRFPALPGHALDEDYDFEAPQAFRLWNLWPLDHQGVLDIGDAYADAKFSDWMLGLGDFARFYTGEADCCEMAHPDDENRHGDQPYGLINCDEGEEWAADMRALYVLVDDDGMEHWQAPPRRWSRGLSWPTSDWWEQLLAYGERNAWASLSAYTNDQTVLEDERRYSPWLWLS